MVDSQPTAMCAQAVKWDNSNIFVVVLSVMRFSACKCLSEYPASSRKVCNWSLQEANASPGLD